MDYFFISHFFLRSIETEQKILSPDRPLADMHILTMKLSQRYKHKHGFSGFIVQVQV
jgi:hypothetical protein